MADSSKNSNKSTPSKVQRSRNSKTGNRSYSNGGGFGKPNNLAGGGYDKPKK